MFLLFFKGLMMGFAIAAPVGPIGALCISRTLKIGRLAGLLTGLGAACADSVYGMIAALGLTSVSHFLMTEQIWIHLIGGAFLIYLGIKLFLSPAHNENKLDSEAKLLNMFMTTFFLTLTNPATILSFLAIFSSVNLNFALSSPYVASLLLVLGIFIGSALWWLILSTSVALIKHKLSLKALRRINQCSGLFILGFGVYVLMNIK